MPASRIATVDRGIVSVDGRRRFLKAVRLASPGTDLGRVDLAGALTTLAATGANGLVVDAGQPTGELRRFAEDRGLTVVVAGGPRRPMRPAPDDTTGPPTIALRRPRRLGWATGDERDLPDHFRRSLRPERFLAGFGAPSVAAGDPSLTAPEQRWRDLRSVTHDATDLACLRRHTPPEAFGDAIAWAAATRDYQAMVVRFHVETARRLKYTPLGGVAPDVLVDDRPGATPGLLGPDGSPKEAITALAAAFRPVLAVADRLPPHLHGDEALAIDVHVVNDLPTPVSARVVAILRWATGERRWTFVGDVASDAVRRAGTLSVVVPPISGPLTLTVELEHGDETTASSYRSDVFADPHDH